MRNKKLLSTFLASALAVTMAMPVMAADGTVNVDVKTKRGVMRVEVPTSMAVQVDQFQIIQAGSQIASEDFEMVNKSEMAVKVDIKSTAAIGTDSDGDLAKLASAKAGLKDNEAWLAVAAMSGKSGSTYAYDDGKTADKTENYWELTEANANVTTFDGTNKTAEQTFYLQKGSGAVSHKLAVPDAAGYSAKDKTFAKFYKLTALGTQPTDDTTLQTAVNGDDIYVVATGDVGTDGATVTKLAKGSTLPASTWAGTNTYYTAADDASAPATGSIYVYSTMATASTATGETGSAGFRYIGALSEKKATWSNDDITGITIEYNITGVTADNYDLEKTGLLNGFKGVVKDAAPSLPTTNFTATADTALEVPVNLGKGNLAATGIATITFQRDGSAVAVSAAKFNFANNKITFVADWVTAQLNQITTSRDYEITFNDTAGTKKTFTITK